MKKFLISLEKDVQRRELFFSQPDTMDFKIFTAINTMNESDEYLCKFFDPDSFYQRYSRKMTKGEAGCTLSHLAVYTDIAADTQISEEEYVLVCEDDALFAENFQADLEAVIKQSISADILLIGQSKISDFNDRELSINYPAPPGLLQKKIKETKYKYSRPYKDYFAGTVAYLIRKSAAGVFLRQAEQSGKPFWLADDYELFGKKFNLKIFIIRPLMVIENPNLTSNLEALRGSSKSHFLLKLLKYPLKELMALIRNL